MLNVSSNKPDGRAVRLQRQSYKATTNALASIYANQTEDAPLCSFSMLLPLWLDSNGCGFVPKRSNLRFEDFAGWHSRMILAELPQDGNLRFRVIGENAMGMFGVRIRKGSRFSDLPDITFSDYADYFKAIQAGATYGRHAGMVPFRGSQQSRFEVLDLPAADEEGNVAFLYSFFLYC